MDGAVRQAIAEITRDRTIAETIAALSTDERAALAARLRPLLTDNGTAKKVRTPSSAAHSVIVRCGDRGCAGVVAEAARRVVRFVALQKSVEPDSADEMVVVHVTVDVDHDIDQQPSQPAYCPHCWMQYPLDEVLQEVRTSRLLGRSRRTMPSRL